MKRTSKRNYLEKTLNITQIEFPELLTQIILNNKIINFYDNKVLDLIDFGIDTFYHKISVTLSNKTFCNYCEILLYVKHRSNFIFF